MAPKKMVDAGDEQQQQSTQMTDDQLLQLAVATDFQDKVAGSSSDNMEDIIKRMQSLAINYNKNLKFAKSYIKDINKEDRQQLAKAKGKAKVELTQPVAKL